MTADSPSSGARSPWQVFRIPLLLAGTSLAGLVGALLVDGPADALWSAAVASPLIAMGWRLWPRTPDRP